MAGLKCLQMPVVSLFEISLLTSFFEVLSFYVSSCSLLKNISLDKYFWILLKISLNSVNCCYFVTTKCLYGDSKFRFHHRGCRLCYHLMFVVKIPPTPPKINKTHTTPPPQKTTTKKTPTPNKQHQQKKPQTPPPQKKKKPKQTTTKKTKQQQHASLLSL